MGWMWNRFPPRMRRALNAAMQDAAFRGRDAVTASDLVAAVARDAESAGAYLLEFCGFDRNKIGVSNDGPARAVLSDRRAGRLDPCALLLLSRAQAAADELGHDHVGTEHVILGLSRSPEIEPAAALIQAGLSADAANDALRAWIAADMPRGSERPLGMKLKSPLLRAAVGPIIKAARLPRVLWAIYGRKSLGHWRFAHNPYPLYRWLREHEPVRRDPLAPVWVLTRYEDVATLMRDPRFRKDPFASERLPRLLRHQLGADADDSRIDSDAVSMLFLDPPGHTRVRGMFARAFTPASLAELRPGIERKTAERLEAARAAGGMDFIADLAYPLPVIVIAELLGFPAEDYPRIKQWSDDLAASISLTATREMHVRAGQSRRQMLTYFDTIISQTQQQPRDTLLSRLLAMEKEPGGLTRAELFSNIVLLLAAGHETTTNLLGNCMLALLEHRDQWEKVVKDPSLIPQAIEETLRYDCPVQWTSRVAGERMEINGKTIEMGEILLGSMGAANRDPERFAEPDRYDLSRADNKHLAFGTGIHFCLGAALARMEAEIVFRAVVERFPTIRLARRKLKWLKGLTFRGVKRLPVRWD
jgi:cytochrome P450